MPRTTLLFALVLTFAGASGATTLGAQSTTPGLPDVPATTDSALLVRVLPAQHVVAKQQKASRQGVLALMAENRRLEGELRRQDEKIESLTRRLVHLKGHVTDSVTRDITRLDAQAAETRARRLALEARLNALEGYAGSTVAP